MKLVTKILCVWLIRKLIYNHRYVETPFKQLTG